LISPSGHLCLADFGLSVTQRQVDSLLVGKAGTVPYLAPEVFASQTRGLFNSTALDIWAFGMLVFEMIHGAEEVKYPILASHFVEGLAISHIFRMKEETPKLKSFQMSIRS
jgi:serine/threonine protein kinase